MPVWKMPPRQDNLIPVPRQDNLMPVPTQDLMPVGPNPTGDTRQYQGLKPPISMAPNPTQNDLKAMYSEILAAKSATPMTLPDSGYNQGMLSQEPGSMAMTGGAGKAGKGTMPRGRSLSGGY